VSLAGWVKSALSPHIPQTAIEIRERIPATVTLTEVVGMIRDLVDRGVAERHEPAEGKQEATYTLRVSP
jgi:hypothetical protein